MKNEIIEKLENTPIEQLENFLDEITELSELHAFMEFTAKVDRAARKDKGFRDSFTKIYDDRTHFLYELLQNAEDAGATEVYFKLNSDSLEFRHNGTDIFDLEDIKSITGWGNSTKKKDNGTKIGKFGIGFKSVYGYTDTPEIYSRDYNFKIEDFFVPTEIEEKENLDETQTLFVLPFNYEDKISTKAYEEIKKGLNDMPSETLLFLNQIKKLEWEIRGISNCIEKKQDEHVCSMYRNGVLITKYLRFDGKASYYDQNDEEKKLPISIAYKLSLEKDNTIIRENDDCNVYTFFKVKNEHAKVYFLINALFELTQARDKLISESEINQDIMSQIADLQVESMVYLRDNGYLTAEFLGVLPNSSDNLPSIYRVFYEGLTELFNNCNYTPTMSGKFLPAQKLYRGEPMYQNGPHIAEFISGEELYALINYDEVNYTKKKFEWAKNAFDARATLFLQSLDMTDFKRKEFCEWFEGYDWSDNKKDEWKKFIEKKEIKDLYKLYLMFCKYYEDNFDADIELEDFVMFRCIDGKMYSLNDKVFIQPEKKLEKEILNAYNFIDERSFGTSSQQKNKIYRLFTDKFGIDEFSAETMEQDKFEKICSKYSDDDSEYYRTTDDISISEHIEDIKFLLKYRKRFGYDDIADTLKDIPFILTTDENYVTVDAVYSNTRYGNSHDLLSEACDILDLSEINIVYKEKLSGKQVEEFINLLNNLNIHKLLRFERQHPVNNPKWSYLRGSYGNRSSRYENYYDADIVGLEKIIKIIRGKPLLSKLIWLTIMCSNAKEYPTSAYYKANASDIKKSVPALYICTLKENAWILDKNNHLRKPEDMTFEDLPDDWKRPAEDYEHPVLKAIEFGKNSQQRREEQLKKDQFARENGFKNAEQMEEAKELIELVEQYGGIEVLRNEVARRNQNAQSELPKSAPKNSAIRGGKIVQETEEANDKTTISTNRTVRITRLPTQIIHNYLRDNYTEDGVMYCQMCHNHERPHELPFKKRDGNYYLVATEIFDEKAEVKYKYLALCPNCHAEYDEWVRNDKDMTESMRDKIKERRYADEESVEINFSIHGDKRTLYFTGKHYHDMRTSLFKDIDSNPNQNFYESLESKNVVLQAGDTVFHEKYGEGRVLSVDNQYVKVKFSTGTMDIKIDFLKKKVSNLK